MTKRRVTKPNPRQCKDACPEEIRRRYGCGFRGYRSTFKLTGSELRECPQYTLTDPDVAFIFSNLEDYRRGALGPVGRLPAHHVDYYRAAEMAWREWGDLQQTETQ